MRGRGRETRKTLSGRVSYLLNKSALDDESRANARIDVKKLRNKCTQSQKNAKNSITTREAQEANKVLTEAMRLKHEEIEKLRRQSNEKVGQKSEKT